MNAITVSSLTASNTTSKKSKLNQLWADIEKKRQRNQRFQDKLETFYDYFKTSTEQHEHEICFATQKWIDHLLAFIPRKTIKGYQREALYDWIHEELTILESNPFNPVNTQTLRETFNQALFDHADNQPVEDDISNEALEAFVEELEMMLGHEIDLPPESLMDMMKEPHKFQAYLQQLLAEKSKAQYSDEEENMEWDAQDFFSQSGSNAKFGKPKARANQALYNDKQMTRLYRQLAKQLHPDKETDEAEKVKKSALMQQLSQAKKEKDVVALLLMAQQYLPDHEMVIDEGMLERLQATLKEKISQLNIEYGALRCGDDIKSIVWQRFGGGSKATRERDLKKYRDSLERNVEDLLQKCQKVRTVKDMQQQLKERANAESFPFHSISINPAEFFGTDADWF